MTARKRKGFTLIELIVVIAIVGVLAAILVPAMMGYVHKAQKTTDRANAKEIATAVMSVLADTEHPEYYTAFYKHNTYNPTATVTANGTTESYNLRIVCYMDASGRRAYRGGGIRYAWQNGNSEAADFVEGLNTEMGYSQHANGKGAYNALVRYKMYKDEDACTWAVGYRDDDHSTLEIWLTTANGGPNVPVIRMWPIADDDAY